MPIEKVFAINAPPREIFAALDRDIDSAREHAGDTFEVTRRDPPRSMQLRVTIGGVPCWLTYTLEPRGDATEVAANLVPFGWKYAFFKIITFGLRDHNFEIALVEGLANLKAAVEDEDDDAAPGIDEMIIDDE
jgi:hypothetical protein